MTDSGGLTSLSHVYNNARLVVDDAGPGQILAVF